MNIKFVTPVLILSLILLISCHKEKAKPPTVITYSITEISPTSATSGGEITDGGGAPVLSRGVCWNTSDDPTTENNKTIESKATSFYSNITGLLPNTTYYVKAYAVTAAGTGYGESYSFRTLGDKPVSNSLNASNIQFTTVTLKGSVNSNLLQTTVTFEYGVTTSYGSNAVASESPLTDVSTKNVSADVTGLLIGTTYHFRVKAENTLGITYSSDMTFKTLGQVPDARVQAATNILVNGARINGSVNPNYLSTAVTFEWGTTAGYGNTLVPSGSPLTGNLFINISADVTGLAPGITYHFRVKATNDLGSTYSDDLIFTTLGQTPSATIQSAANLLVSSATLKGSVNPNYLSTTVSFEWGTTNGYGNIAAVAQSPLTGSSAINISTDISPLAPGTVYHYRIKAENSLGISYSSDMIFQTLGQAPSAVTLASTGLQYYTAELNGSVSPNYLSSAVTFEWGTTTSYGNTAVASQSPLTGNAIINVSAVISGLSQGVTYHLRVKATNLLGTGYGNDMIFTTLSPVTDVEGNSYNIKTIGNQVWMTENLKTSKYRNGEVINTTSPASLDISGETAPNYQWAYNANESNVATYGRLYTWNAAMDIRNVCPAGWHIPSDNEWTILTNYLINNGYGYEGSGSDIGKSMSAGSLWNSDPTPGNVGNQLATNNSSGFSALPGGMRMNNLGTNGEFSVLGNSALFWTSTEFTPTIAWQRIINFLDNNINRTYSGGKQAGISIRCIKD